MRENGVTTKSGNGRLTGASLPIEIFPEGRIFIAHCPALRLASHGSTRESAKKALKEALGIFFEEIERKGTLEEVLLECGWVKDEKSPNRPSRLVPPRITTGNISVPASIPLPV